MLPLTYSFLIILSYMLSSSIVSPFHIPEKTERRRFFAVRNKMTLRESYKVPAVEYDETSDYMADDYSAEMAMEPQEGNPLYENPDRDDLIEGDIMIDPIKGRFVYSRAKKWPGGVVKYEINPGFSEKHIGEIKYAMHHISKVSCVKFEEYKKSKDKDYVSFTLDKDRCTSHLGRKGGKQTLYLRRTCRFGTVVHEVMHALGFEHEQNRSDRDKWVKVYDKNVKDNRKRDFAKYKPEEELTFGKRYDLHSVMHYGPKIASKNEYDTMGITEELAKFYHKIIKGAKYVPFEVYKEILLGQMGQASYLSDIDQEKLNLYYCTK